MDPAGTADLLSLHQVSTMRSLISLLALSLATALHAQSGIRVITGTLEPVYTEWAAGFVHYGLGFDHDLNERLSYGVDLTIMLVGNWTAEYRCQYHFADNTRSSFYMGSSLGVRHIGDHYTKVLVPMGVRMGVRGGLPGLYGDLYLGGKFQAGADGSAVRVGGDMYPGTLATTILLGLDIGFGWDRR